MDNVKITLQNRELIEDLINNSNNLELEIHNAIIDGVSKRTLKAVMNDMEVAKRIDDAKRKAEDEISKKYFNSEKSNWGYSTVYTLKPEYQKIIDKEIEKAFNSKLNSKISEVTKDIAKPYTEELNKILNNWVEKIKKYDIDELARKAISEAVEKRFGKP